MEPASEALMIAEAFWGVVDWDRQERAVTARTTGRTRRERRRSMSSYRTSRACNAATKMIDWGRLTLLASVFFRDHFRSRRSRQRENYDAAAS